MTHDLIGTYRIQLRPEFGFRETARIVPYLQRLGVSHVYLSPVFEAAPGSTHGYDVVDPNALRSELGGRAGFDELLAALDEHDLGLVLDIVPHHMAASAENPWWWSVLELGRDSPYASHFDIDWDPPEQRLRGTLLLPVLGDHYGRVLEAGELRLAHEDHQLVVRYFEHVAPLSPDTAEEVWAEAGRTGRPVEEILDQINRDVDRLDDLLSRQHHRFARWQAAAHELDYRRFFDVDSLVALRSERPAVFDDTHRLVRELAASEQVDGLRVDHVDGLRDPEAYLSRLRAAAPGTWLTVEKILRPHESIPDTWSADGTTGYDFLAAAGGVLLDAAGVDRLIEGYALVTADDATYEETKTAAKREVLREALAADVDRVVERLLRVCEHNRRSRDFTRTELRQAIDALCVQAPGYRSYVRPGLEPTESDRRFIGIMIDAARVARPDLDDGIFEFLRSVLLGELSGENEAEFVARFQQLTGPVAAKGEEDTAFYRWMPLLCLNEVGVEPDEAVVSVSAFHDDCADRQSRRPTGMLTTSTHDTKRSEDVRARLAVLSERPDEWIEAVQRWCAHNERHRDAELDAPDSRDEWFIYQTLLGAHPLPFERAWPVIEKSLRESKRRTSWIRVNEDYEDATRSFLKSVLEDEAFQRDFGAFVSELVEPGRINSLTLTTLRLLCPGVPDTYQGTELWDLSLVDPDNRRAVEYGQREALLGSIDQTDAADLWASDVDSGAAKFALVRAGLALRRRHADVFTGARSSYSPLDVTGLDADRVVAFERGGVVAAVVPRLPRSGLPDDAIVTLPDGGWTNALTDEQHAGDVAFGKLRGGFPVALLERDDQPVG